MHKKICENNNIYVKYAKETGEFLSIGLPQMKNPLSLIVSTIKISYNFTGIV